MSELLTALEVRQEKVSNHFNALDWRMQNDNRKLIDSFGFAYYEEFASHRSGTPLVSTYFRDVHGRPPNGKAESMRHSRALRRLAKSGSIELYGESQVRWAKITLPKT